MLKNFTVPLRGLRHLEELYGKITYKKHRGWDVFFERMIH